MCVCVGTGDNSFVLSSRYIHFRQHIDPTTTTTNIIVLFLWSLPPPPRRRPHRLIYRSSQFHSFICGRSIVYNWHKSNRPVNTHTQFEWGVSHSLRVRVSCSMCDVFVLLLLICLSRAAEASMSLLQQRRLHINWKSRIRTYNLILFYLFTFAYLSIYRDCTIVLSITDQFDHCIYRFSIEIYFSKVIIF